MDAETPMTLVLQQLAKHDASCKVELFGASRALENSVGDDCAIGPVSKNRSGKRVARPPVMVGHRTLKQ